MAVARQIIIPSQRTKALRECKFVCSWLIHVACRDQELAETVPISPDNSSGCGGLIVPFPMRSGSDADMPSVGELMRAGRQSR
jgi:hypothetical protein